MTMNLPRFQTTIFPNYPVTHPRRVLLMLPMPVTCYFRRQTSPKQPITFTRHNQTVPARDRVIDFGKYKGRMLGTLPSTYLKWVSKNLRARDFEKWAHLADQVLQDPVYKDRIEWEFAENVLNGNQSKALSSSSSSSSGDGEATAVAELMDISQRFGWDNQDKDGWAKIKFELLGTSKGGRIPRLEKREEEDSRAETLGKEKERGLDLEASSGVGGRRKERRERQKKIRKEAQNQNQTTWERESNNSGIKEKKRGSFANGIEGDRDVLTYQSERQMEQNQNGNPFPGREGLLRKVLNRRRLVP